MIPSQNILRNIFFLNINSVTKKIYILIFFFLFAKGKSTFAKQFKILFITGFNEEEKKLYIPQLFSNIVTGIVSLIDLAEKRGFEINNQEAKNQMINMDPIR